MTSITQKYHRYRTIFERVSVQTKIFVITAVVQFLVLESLAWVNFAQYVQISPTAFTGGP